MHAFDPNGTLHRKQARRRKMVRACLLALATSALVLTMACVALVGQTPKPADPPKTAEKLSTLFDAKGGSYAFLNIWPGYSHGCKFPHWDEARKACTIQIIFDTDGEPLQCSPIANNVIVCWYEPKKQ